MNKQVEELYTEREARVNRAIALENNDRVPIIFMFGFFFAKYAATTPYELMYNSEKLYEQGKKVILDYQPDMYANPIMYVYPGKLLDSMDFKLLRWPGHGIAEKNPYQFVENEYMGTDEYDELIYDPSDWILRRYLPRVCGNLEPLEKLLPLRQYLSYNTIVQKFAAFGNPKVITALESLIAAGRESYKMIQQAIAFKNELTSLGFPSQSESVTLAPFDALGDCLRGTKGLMLDLYRKPDKVLEACEKLTPLLIEMGVNDAQRTGIPRVFIPLHKGAEGFMSLDQFRKFYWPGLNKLINGLIENDITPCLFIEGNYNSRLEIIADIPKGRAIYHFESTDIFKAKAVLGKQVCIRGNVPLSLLSTGSVEDIKAYCKKLIDVVGKGGGFIMDATGVLDDAKPENVKAMVDFTREYGVYS